MNIHALGFETYVFQVSHDFKMTATIQEYLHSHPSCLFTYFYMDLQEWTLDIGFFVRHPEEIRSIISSLKKEFNE